MREYNKGSVYSRYTKEDGKKHRLMLAALGAFFVVLSVLFMIFARQGFIFNEYRANGKAVQATVADKYRSDESHINVSQFEPGRVSSKSSVRYLLDVTYFEGGSQTGGDFISAVVRADGIDLTSLKEGSETDVVYLPENPLGTALLQVSVEKALIDDALRQRYKQDGITVKATVFGTDEQQQTVNLMFMTSLSLSLGDYQKTTLDVDQSIWDALKTGDKMDVMVLPGKPESPAFAAIMIEKGAVNAVVMIIVAVCLLLAGVVLMWRFRPKKNKNMKANKKAQKHVLVNTALSMALEWGENNGKPLGPRLKQLYPNLQGAKAAELEVLCKEIKKFTFDIVEHVYTNQISAEEAKRRIYDEYPFISDENLADLYNQGMYYAWHG